MEDEACQALEEAKFIVFNLGEEQFGVDISKVYRIIDLTEITQIPKSKEYIQGVINLRGQITPIINLRKRLGLPEKEIDEKAKIIIADFKYESVGMIVDSVVGVRSIRGENLEETPSLVKNKIKDNFVEGIGKLEDELIIILNIEHICLQKEESK